MAEKSTAHQALTITPPPGPVFNSENVVYLMGLSFIIGSLFTIFILILLDFMQRNTMKRRDD